MITTAGHALRWGRALIVAAIALGLGAAAHVQADGLLPGVATLLVLLAVMTVAAAVALGRPATYAVIAALTIGGQAMAHTVFSLTAGHGGVERFAADAVVTPTVLPRNQTALDGLAVVSDPTGAQVSGGASFGLGHIVADLTTGSGLLMTLAHAAVAAVVAWWLYVGETALWGLLAMLGAVLLQRLVHLFLGVRTARRPRLAAAPSYAGMLARWRMRGGLGLRGPPLIPCALT